VSLLSARFLAREDGSGVAAARLLSTWTSFLATGWCAFRVDNWLYWIAADMSWFRSRARVIRYAACF